MYLQFQTSDRSILPVDRILGQRQLERQTKEIRVEDEHIELLSSSPQPPIERTLTSPSSSTLTSDLSAVDRTSSLSSTFKKLKQKLGVTGSSVQLSGFSGVPVRHENEVEYQDPQLPGSFSKPSSSPRPYDNSTVTPLTKIGECQ